MNNPLGLYIHIPFCLKKCRYCDFYSGIYDPSLADSYTEELIKRLKLLPLIPGIRPFSSVYFGGGTPTLIGEERLLRILSTAEKSVGFSEKAEISFEANPATVNKEQLKKLNRGGFNRISVGVQSFHDPQLSLIGRLHTADQACRTLYDASEAGFTNINADLMLGLPSSTIETVRASVDKALSCGVTHISAYCLKLEPGTLMFRDYPEGKGLPTDDETADQYLNISAQLKQAGFHHYEISNFAIPGFECKHNLLYWHLNEYIGLGPSAHSFYNGKRFYFGRSELRSLPKNGDPFEETLPEDFDRESEYIMLSLRTSSGIDPEKTQIPEVIRSVLTPLIAHSLVQKTNSGFRLTPQGWLVSNSIISDILLKSESFLKGKHL